MRYGSRRGSETTGSRDRRDELNFAVPISAVIFYLGTTPDAPHVADATEIEL